MKDNSIHSFRVLIAACDASFGVLGVSPLDREQRDCLLDPKRAEEAYAMVDDLEARVGLHPDVANMARMFIEHNEAAHEAMERRDAMEKAADAQRDGFNEWRTIPVPDVVRVFGFIDESWHNDACARATLKLSDGTVLWLWCEHIDISDREPGFMRFALQHSHDDQSTDAYTTLYEGESEREVAQAIALAIAAHSRIPTGAC